MTLRPHRYSDDIVLVAFTGRDERVRCVAETRAFHDLNRNPSRR